MGGSFKTDWPAGFAGFSGRVGAVYAQIKTPIKIGNKWQFYTTDFFKTKCDLEAEIMTISWFTAISFIFLAKISRLRGVIFFESRTLYSINSRSSSNVTPEITMGPITGPLGEKDS